MLGPYTEIIPHEYVKVDSKVIMPAGWFQTADGKFRHISYNNMKASLDPARAKQLWISQGTMKPDGTLTEIGAKQVAEQKPIIQNGVGSNLAPLAPGQNDAVQTTYKPPTDSSFAIAANPLLAAMGFEPNDTVGLPGYVAPNFTRPADPVGSITTYNKDFVGPNTVSAAEAARLEAEKQRAALAIPAAPTSTQPTAQAAPIQTTQTMQAQAQAPVQAPAPTPAPAPVSAPAPAPIQAAPAEQITPLMQLMKALNLGGVNSMGMDTGGAPWIPPQTGAAPIPPGSMPPLPPGWMPGTPQPGAPPVVPTNGMPGPNGPPGGNPIPGQTPDAFNLPQYNGAYAAPLLGGQLDALQGFNQLANGQPLLQSQDIATAIQTSINGGPLFAPNAGKSLQEATQPFNLPSAAGDLAKQGATTGFKSDAPGLTDMSQISNQMGSLGQSLNTAVSAPRFDATDMFKAGESVFNSDLNNSLAKIKEEMSGLGMGPGSTDRMGAMTREAGDSAARFRLGQLDLGRQSFESAEDRRLGALNIGNQSLATNAAINQIPFQQQMSIAQNINNPAADRMTNLIPHLNQIEQQPWERYYKMGTDAANRNLQALPAMFEAQKLPMEQLMQKFALNESARQVPDQESQRRMAEFARTQGGGLNQLLAILSGVPLNNTMVGPSPTSQIGNILSSLIGAIIPG